MISAPLAHRSVCGIVIATIFCSLWELDQAKVIKSALLREELRDRATMRNVMKHICCGFYYA